MMIPAHWAAELINHLWQSTVFAAAVWLLVLALRKNQARTRYWLWMIASVKFLIPFSLLIAIGGYLRPAAAAPAAPQAFSMVVDQIAQPFSQAQFPADAASTVVAATPATTVHWGVIAGFVLMGCWLCGSLIIAFVWLRQWWKIRAAVRGAIDLAMVADVPVLSSPLLIEPGVFGIIRPVLLLPEGIVERLTASQMTAIVTHEMCHIWRRDNLTAAIHMLVEDIFWFHPMVWWLRTRLVEERERACDEAVLQSGSEAHVYAEGILNVCKFYVESPLTCVSGVTGSDLKKRIVRIMTEQVSRKLNFSRKLLLGMAGVAAVAAPIVFGLAHVREVRAQAENPVQRLVGNWQGTLQAGQGLRTVLKISNEDGKLKALMYSIDQGGEPIAVTSISLQGTSVNFTIKPLDVTYVGTLNPDGNTISGNATQHGQTHVLNLEHMSAENTWAIPEPPKPMAADAVPKFEVATVKPSDPNRPGKLFTVRGRHVMTINTNLNDLITFAYGLHVKQIIGAPAWFGTEKFDIDGVPDVEGRPSSKQMKLLFQSALADRFKLTFHHDQKELSVYALTVGKGGPKMTETIHKPADPVNFLFRGKLGALMVTNATMKDFCDGMQGAVMDRPVVDHTGLTARYDFNLNWTPDESQFAAMGARIPPPTDDPNAPPGLYTALQEQLGLKLDPTKANADVFVIDHVEQPSAN